MTTEVKEKPYKALAEWVRNDSKIYPKTTKVETFKAWPFNLSAETLNEYISAMLEDEEYKDIHLIKASTGVLYLYSDKYLTEPGAKYLVERLEVGIYENP